jgi:parallel beta-helix repeat protein
MPSREDTLADRRSARALAYGVLALTFTLAGRAQAVDGVIEINQARADQGGITPGDAPGLPITISASQPMSCRLTGPLTNSTTADVIQILSPHITVDLNGFMVACASPQCSGTGVVSSEDDVTVINGTVRGFSEGVDLGGAAARLENMRALGNGVGLRAGNDCTVRDSHTSGSGNDGIRVGAGCLVSGNTSNDNGDDGICADHGCTLIGNTVRGNTGYGLDLSTDTGYSQNVISDRYRRHRAQRRVDGPQSVQRQRHLPVTSHLAVAYSSSISASKLTSSAARFSKRVYSEKKVSGTVPVGPLRCLPMIASASCSSAFFAS